MGLSLHTVLSPGSYAHTRTTKERNICRLSLGVCKVYAASGVAQGDLRIWLPVHCAGQPPWAEGSLSISLPSMLPAAPGTHCDGAVGVFTLPFCVPWEQALRVAPPLL